MLANFKAVLRTIFAAITAAAVFQLPVSLKLRETHLEMRAEKAQIAK